MAHAREFDDTAILDAATNRSWRQGYAAPSLRALEEALGLVPAIR